MSVAYRLNDSHIGSPALHSIARVTAYAAVNSVPGTLVVFKKYPFGSKYLHSSRETENLIDN